MRILQDLISFIWDTGNLTKNLVKHNVTITEAEELFINEPITIAVDRKHSSIHEQRYYALGKSKNNRTLFTAFTIRDSKIRIISIRDMSNKERQIYENLENDS